MTSDDLPAVLAPIRERLAQALIALDFDGTLAPIVPRPGDARALPGTADVLTRLARMAGQVAVITGRPAAEAVALGDLASVPDLVVLGHYGLERWMSGELMAPAADAAVDELRRRLAELASANPGVEVEDKHHSVALHTRNAPEPAAALNALGPRVAELAAAAGFQVTPGRFVLEIRPRGMDKGSALTSLVAEVNATAVLYAGDDTGDLPAVEALRALDVVGVVVCSDAAEADPRLRAAADVVVPGPEGVQRLLRNLPTPGVDHGQKQIIP